MFLAPRGLPIPRQPLRKSCRLPSCYSLLTLLSSAFVTQMWVPSKQAADDLNLTLSQEYRATNPAVLYVLDRDRKIQYSGAPVPSPS